MIRCDTAVKNTLVGVSLYISRAYRPNQVFVYVKVPPGRIFLDNLSFNVSVTDEPIGFDDVE